MREEEEERFEQEAEARRREGQAKAAAEKRRMEREEREAEAAASQETRDVYEEGKAGKEGYITVMVSVSGAVGRLKGLAHGKCKVRLPNDETGSARLLKRLIRLQTGVDLDRQRLISGG
jgi:hypothetical protein